VHSDKLRFLGNPRLAIERCADVGQRADGDNLYFPAGIHHGVDESLDAVFVDLADTTKACSPSPMRPDGDCRHAA